MKIFVTGGSGFVGTYIVRDLAGRGEGVRSLSRSGTSLVDGVEGVRGDILDPESLSTAMDGCDVVIHLVGIIDEKPSEGITFERVYEEGTRNVVDAAVAARVDTFVYMSANGVRENGVSAYQTGKWAAEEMVRAAGFRSSTVFRPSLVFGAPIEGRREFASDLVDQLIRPFPVLPIFGDGAYQLKPVAVESVAKAFADAATNGPDGTRSYCVAGPRSLSYVDIVDVITRASGRKVKPKVHVPIGLVRFGLDIMGWTGLLPISRDQLDMLVEGNVCDENRFVRDFEIDEVPFSEENLSYLGEKAKR